MDIFELLLEQNKKQKELFNMIYRWGQWGVQADYMSPAFQMTMKELKESYE